ncbi:hypothetical protein CPB86DRAFT_113924 [Serendipita vermifera]|nr:hypothetical protein CPB86DRAFT_113924 [Serendipita vermifera]
MLTLSDYRVPDRDFPKILYRVDHEDSWTRCHGALGFLAARPCYIPKDKDEFVEAVEKHLDWKSGVASPFISLFRDHGHAINWAKKWSKNCPGKSCVVTKIMIESSDDVALFFVPKLIRKLNVKSPNPNFHVNEYLCLHNVPLTCIVNPHTSPAPWTGRRYGRVIPDPIIRSLDQLSSRDARRYRKVFRRCTRDILENTRMT